MKRIALTALLALLLAVPAFANGDGTSAKRTHSTSQPRDASGRFVARPAATLWDTLVESFELSAGFRWQTELDREVHDPFYLGAGVRLPLAKNTGWHTQFDRDFTDEARWQLRTEVTFAPFSR